MKRLRLFPGSFLVAALLTMGLSSTVASNRIVRYGPMPDELSRSIDDVVAAGIEALRDPSTVDNPALDALVAPVA